MASYDERGSEKMSSGEGAASAVEEINQAAVPLSPVAHITREDGAGDEEGSKARSVVGTPTRPPDSRSEKEQEGGLEMQLPISKEEEFAAMKLATEETDASTVPTDDRSMSGGLIVSVFPL